MSNINLNLYKIFCKVAQSKSYSEAAEKLDLSVANVSTQIANLEEQLNLKLFNRENKGVTLTENGKELYEIVNKSISGFDFAEKLAKDKNDISSGCIKIGCPSHFTSYLLMEKIEKVKRDYPDLNIKIICEVDINKMMSLLQNHEIDFAIIDTEIENSNIEIKYKRMDLLSEDIVFDCKFDNITQFGLLGLLRDEDEFIKKTRDIMNALKRNGVYIGVNWIFSKIYQKKMGFSNEYISERLLSNIETRSIKLIYYEEVEIKNDPNYDKCIIYVIKGGEKLWDSIVDYLAMFNH